MTIEPLQGSWRVQAVTGSPEETRQLAAAVAGACRPGDVLLLVGGLGAGKTTFVQGFAAACGVEGPVASPTFALVRQYPTAPTAPTAPTGPTGPTGPLPPARPSPEAHRGLREVIHADVYRLDSLAAIVDLGLAELAEDGAILLVEWGERAAPVFGDDVLVVTLTPRLGAGLDPQGRPGAEGRAVCLEGSGPSWVDRQEILAGAVAAFGAGPKEAP